MENSNLPQVVIDRWNEAVKSNSVPAWRSLALMTENLAESMKKRSPDKIMHAALHGVSVSAYARYIQLQKVTEHADAT